MQLSPGLLPSKEVWKWLVGVILLAGFPLPSRYTVAAHPHTASFIGSTRASMTFQIVTENKFCFDNGYICESNTNTHTHVQVYSYVYIHLHTYIYAVCVIKSWALLACLSCASNYCILTEFMYHIHIRKQILSFHVCLCVYNIRVFRRVGLSKSYVNIFQVWTFTCDLFPNSEVNVKCMCVFASLLL